MTIFNYFNRIFNSDCSNLVNGSKNEKEAKIARSHFRENLSRSQSNNPTSQDAISILLRGFNSLN
jgi:hypothetical protein